MNVHKNARLTPYGRERMVMMVLHGQTPQAVGRAVGVCPRTVRKWVNRYENEDAAGLLDRRSRPMRLYRPTSPEVVERIEALRRQRLGIRQGLSNLKRARRPAASLDAPLQLAAAPWQYRL